MKHMKKIMTLLIVAFFILNGVISIVSSNDFAINSFLKSPDSKISIIPITIPNLLNNQNINSDITQAIKELTSHTVAYKQPLKLNENYKEIKPQQKITEFQKNLQTYNYVIITKNTLNIAITSSTFLEWKKLLGYKIKIVNITDEEIAYQSGNDLPEQIRNFLRSYYQIWGIQYVLIVGNHATIPMRYCYPDPTNHRFDPFDWTSGEVPTDYYYADLSSSDSESWDLDNDGYYGEYSQDNPDFLAEVYVGRIPTNNITRITYTLNKIVSFEQDTGDWKNNALNAGAFFYFTNEDYSGNPAMDGAVLSYYIEKDIMDNWTIDHFSEQGGLETSIYDWPALTESAFINKWRNGQYAIVNWQGHGWTNRVARKVWSWDDGDGVPEANEIFWPDFININFNLDDDFPSIVTAVSCYVGCPEPETSGNLGIDLLTNPSLGASIGVIASARSPYGSFDWPNNPGGSESIIYEFNNLLINESKKIGEALYDSKFYCNENYGWAHFAEYLDMYTFNLFGEPSLVFKGIVNENHPPVKPTINGPGNGEPGVEYTFCINISDPDKDILYVLWEWDDGTNSDWLGPYESGSEVCESHVWNEKGTYMIKVIVRDEIGATATGYLDFTIPRNRLSYQKFLSSYFSCFTNLFQILKMITQKQG